MKFGHKDSPPEKDAPPPLPQAALDFVNAVKPSEKLSPLADLQKTPHYIGSNVTPSLPAGGGLHTVDRIVEIRIRQWMEEMQKAEQDMKGGRRSGRSLNFFPPRR